MNGSDIRIFFRELFGSRLVSSLEQQMLQMRQDFEFRLQDKDQVIAELRTERAIMQGRIAIYENTLMPMASRVRAQNIDKPKFSATDIINSLPKTRWEVEQEAHEKEMERLDAEEAKAKAAEKK